MHGHERYKATITGNYGATIGKVNTIFYDVVSIDEMVKASFTHVVPTWRVTKDARIDIEALPVGTPCEIVVVAGEDAKFDMPVESIVWETCNPGGGG